VLTAGVVVTVDVTACKPPRVAIEMTPLGDPNSEVGSSEFGFSVFGLSEVKFQLTW
jgi:hypothetical protein